MRQTDLGTRPQWTWPHSWLGAQGWAPKGRTPGHLNRDFWNIAHLPSAFPSLGQCRNLSSSTMDGETGASSFSRALRIPRWPSSPSWRCSPPACTHPTTFLWPVAAMHLFSSQGLPSHLGLCLCSFLAEKNFPLCCFSPVSSTIASPLCPGGEFLFASWFA